MCLILKSNTCFFLSFARAGIQQKINSLNVPRQIPFLFFTFVIETSRRMFSSIVYPIQYDYINIFSTALVSFTFLSNFLFTPLCFA